MLSIAIFFDKIWVVEQLDLEIDVRTQSSTNILKHSPFLYTYMLDLPPGPQDSSYIHEGLGMHPGVSGDL